MTFRQSIGIVLGANVGTAITAQIIRLMDVSAGSTSLLYFFKADNLAPVSLDDPSARDYLTAFVWADQPERLRRLRTALAELARVNEGDAPVRLSPRRLPDELPAWLDALPNHRPECPRQDCFAAMTPVLTSWTNCPLLAL